MVVDGVDDRHHEADVDPRGVAILDRAQLDVEEIADLAMSVRRFADAVELEVGDAQAGLARRLRERRVLCEANPVGRRLDAEVADLGRIPDGIEEDRRNGRLSAGELHGHLPPRLHRQRIVQKTLDLVEGQLVDVADLIGVHEAGVAHHVAAVGQVNRQDRPAPVLDGRRAVVVQLVGDRVEVAARKETLDAAQKIRIDGQRIGEGAVLRAGLLDNDLAVALDDVGFDLANVRVDQRGDGLFAGENSRPGFAHAARAQRVGRPRPAQLRSRTLRALHERRRRPRGLKGWRLELPVDGLEQRPGQAGAVGRSNLERSPHVHPIDLPGQSSDGMAMKMLPTQLRRIANYSTPLSAVRLNRSRTIASSRARSVLPRSVSGIRSSQTMVRGILCAASREPQNCRMSGAVKP